MRHSLQRSQNWATRPSRKIDKNFEEMTAADKTWFANNSKGSEAGLSISEVRLRPPSSIVIEGEQKDEQQE